MLVESSAVLGRGCGVPVSAERIMGTVEGGGCGEIRMGSIPGAGTHLASTLLRSDAGSSFQFQLVSADSIRVDCSAIKGFPRHPGSQLDLQTNTFRGITII